MKYRNGFCSFSVLFALVAFGNVLAETRRPENPRPEEAQPAKVAREGDDQLNEGRKPVPRTSKFTFAGSPYRVAKAEIVATIGDPYWCDKYNGGKGKAISWTISFTAESDSEDKLPRRFLDVEGLLIPAKNWHDLVGYKTAWDKSIDPKTGERYGLIDQQLIAAGRVQITGRSGSEFRIVASGKNEEGTAFSVDAPAVFKGIYVRGSERDSEETIQARLQEQIDDSNLVGTPFKLGLKYGSGLKAGTSFFSPTTKDR